MSDAPSPIRTLKEFCAPGQPVSRLVLGLTGNPGAGKSTVARLLEEHGAILVDADDIGHYLPQRESPPYTELVRVFGRGILDDQKNIVRPALGRIVFQDAARRDELNRIIHPPLLAAIWERIRQFRAANEAGPLVVDAALLYEWDVADWFDVVLVVSAPGERRHARIIASKGTDPETIRQMESAQFPESYKINRADLVIPNDGDQDALSNTVQQLFKLNLY